MHGHLGAGSEGGGARQLKNGSNKPEEKDCRVNNRNSEVAPLLSTSTSDTSSDSHPNNNTCSKYSLLTELLKGQEMILGSNTYIAFNLWYP